MEAQEQKLAELTEKFNKRLDVVIKANPNENFEVADRERSEEGLSNKLHQLRGSNHSLQNQAIDYLRHNILELRTEERNLEIAQGKNLGTLFISQDPFDNLLAIFQKLAERKKELNIEQTHIIGGKIKDLAGKILSDPNFKYLFDETTQNTLQLYLNNSSVGKVPLTSKDYSAISNRWSEEFNNPTELSSRMTNEQISEKVNEYYQKFQNALRNERELLKPKNMENTTVQEIFNEIQENFNPKEKAYLELKLINNIDGHHNMNMIEVGNHLTSAEIENVHQYISKLEDKHYKPIIDSEGWSEDKNYNKLISDVVNIMENNKDFLNDINPVFLEVSQNAQKKREQFNVVEYLNTQMKYLGFGDTHKEEIQKGIESEDTSFQIHTTSDKVMEGNKVDFSVNFNKTEQGGVFLNSFNAKLTTEQGEERSHNFRINFTAKEAINLLEGRAVKTELSNKEGEKYQAFVRLNFAEEKTEKGNYKFQIFNEKYGVNTLDILSKTGIKFNDLEHRDYLIKSLEKGNIINAKFEHEGKEIQGKAILNPQYKTLNLYDKDMNRINTNKPLQGLEQDNSQEKNNVRQQNISRSL